MEKDLRLSEQRALEAYDTNTPAPIRIAYRDGYEQAEKDLALTWEDARLIVDIGNSILDECYKKGIEPHLIFQTERQFSEEIIKRFKEAKK